MVSDRELKGTLSRPLRMAGAVVLAMATAAAPLSAQDATPMRIMVGFPAGGTIDVVARLVAEHLVTDVKAPVIVENRTGAGGLLAAQAVKQAAPDGRTLLLTPDHTMVMLPLTTIAPGFNPQADFAPVSLVSTYAGGFAVAQANPAKSVREFLDWAKTNTSQANVGIPAAGSVPQFLVGRLAEASGAQVSVVPYRGSAPMVQELLGGQIPAGTTALGDFLEHTGKLKVIAVLGDARSPQLPDVPTLKEQGYNLSWEYWLGLFAPAGTPKAEVDKLNAAVRRVLARPDVQERMRRIVFDPSPSSPDALAERVRANTATWEPVVKASGWKPQ